MILFIEQYSCFYLSKTEIAPGNRSFLNEYPLNLPLPCSSLKTIQFMSLNLLFRPDASLGMHWPTNVIQKHET